MTPGLDCRKLLDTVGTGIRGRIARALTVLTLATLAGCGGGGGAGDSTGSGSVQAAMPWSIVELPVSLGKGLRLHPANDPGTADWCLYRGWPDEKLHVVRDCGGTTPIEVAFPVTGSSELLALQSWPVGDAFIVAIYDAGRNIPSGRSPGRLLDGIDLVRFDRSGPATSLGTLLPLGGLDTLLQGGTTDAGFTVCGSQRCFVASGGKMVEFGAPGLVGYEIVEAVMQPWGVDALVRTALDGSSGAVPDNFSYGWARITRSSAKLMRQVPASCVPHALQSTADNATWSCAVTAADLAAVVQADMARMPHHGLVEIGASNAEGRIAWSQVYYLQGLMHAASGRLPRMAAAIDWGPTRDRLRSELALVALRADEALAGYRAKRYSVQRTPLLFALHLGRIGRMLDTARRLGLDPDQGALARLRILQRMQALTETVEQPTQVYEGEFRFDALRFTPGIDFWCDGANVPYNYTSAYVQGMLALAPDAAATRAAALLAPLTSLEPIADGLTWHYWWNLGRTGWLASSGISTNTPTYAGQPGLADITYRSIDAIAVLALEAAQPRSVAAAKLDHLRVLVAQGSLLPFVNEELLRSPGGAAVLQRSAAYRYARSAAAWEIESQVWAVEALAAAATP